MITARVPRLRILFVCAWLSGCGRVGIELGSLDDGAVDGMSGDAGATPDPCPLDHFIDSDGDGICDSADGCPTDKSKSAPGACGCNVSAPAGLDAYFTFDETMGNTARDSVAAKVGTLQNFSTNPWTPGRVGDALAFDGVDDEVDVAGVASALRGISFWLRPNALAAISTQTSFLSPSSFNSGGDWMQADNAFASDDQYTTSGIMNGASEDWGGFGVALPAGTAITGIETQVKMHTVNLTATFGIELSWNGGTSHTNTNDQAMPTATERYIPFGGPSDLWGHAWTAAELTDSSFRVQLTKAGLNFTPLTPGVDHIRLRVSHAALPVNRPVVALSATATIELSSSTVVATGFPAGTVVFVDGVAGGAVDTGWHHVVVVSPSDVIASLLEVGAASGSAVFFTGLIDDLKFFTVAPTAADLTTLKNSPTCR